MGWHLHAICGDMDNIPVGTLAIGPWVKRLPSVRSYHRRTKFAETDKLGGIEAFLWHQSVRFFNIDGEGSLM